MNTNQIKCITISQPKRKPVERHPVITFGRMICRQFGDRRMILVGKVG